MMKYLLILFFGFCSKNNDQPLKSPCLKEVASLGIFCERIDLNAWWIKHQKSV